MSSYLHTMAPCASGTPNKSDLSSTLLFSDKWKQKNDWVAWTPEGYYAASPGGEKLLGWHVSNGPDQLATFHPLSKFRASLYRPDVIARLLEAGSLDKALAAADQARGQKTTRFEIEQVLPPRTRLSVAGNARQVAEPAVEVKAEADSSGRHPVTALQLLLD